MGPRVRLSSLGYYGCLAIVLGTLLMLVGMRPSVRHGSPQSTPMVTHIGMGFVVAGSAVVSAYGWQQHRERRRSTESPTSAPEAVRRNDHADV
jgi:hypothetical protein